MKVLITGGMGVNGAVTARVLLSEGHRPVLFDNRLDLSLITDIEKEVDLVQGDILDPDSVDKVISDFQITHIAHLAALMPGPAESDPPLGVKVGVDGTLNILEAARHRNLERVVFTSSKAVYGEISGKHAHPDYVPVDETHVQDPEDLYGAIKVCCETLGQYYHKRYGVDFVALRFGSIYGPGKQVRHGVLSLYGQMIEDVAAGKGFSITRGGDQINEALYVGDVARSIVLALKVNHPSQRVFNIGTGRGVTFHDFAKVLRGLYPDTKIEIGPGLDFQGREKRSYCIFDIDQARKVLGFQPKFDLEAGIKDYIQTIERLRPQ
jgi:UDP-glucose 4-epimerase